MTRQERLLIVAHRGATRPEGVGAAQSTQIEENTLEAFREAARQEADGVELDVRMAADGGLIVNHDPWYRDERTIWDTPSPQRPEGVPLLGEALAELFGPRCQVRGRPLGVNVEIKNSPGDLGGDHVLHTLEVADAVVAEIAASTARAAADLGGTAAEVLVSSFDPPTLDRVRSLGGPPTAQLVLDVPGWPDLIRSCVERGHVAVNPYEHFVDQELVDAAASAGLRVNVWTVDDPGRIVELAGLGIDSVITNLPGPSRRALEQDGPPAL